MAQRTTAADGAPDPADGPSARPPADLDERLRAWMGVDETVGASDLDRLHRELNRYLDQAPSPLHEWARRQSRTADAAHAVLTGQAAGDQADGLRDLADLDEDVGGVQRVVGQGRGEGCGEGDAPLGQGAAHEWVDLAGRTRAGRAGPHVGRTEVLGEGRGHLRAGAVVLADEEQVEHLVVRAPLLLRPLGEQVTGPLGHEDGEELGMVRARLDLGARRRHDAGDVLARERGRMPLGQLVDESVEVDVVGCAHRPIVTAQSGSRERPGRSVSPRRSASRAPGCSSMWARPRRR